MLDLLKVGLSDVADSADWLPPEEVGRRSLA